MLCWKGDGETERRRDGETERERGFVRIWRHRAGEYARGRKGWRPFVNYSAC